MKKFKSIAASPKLFRWIVAIFIIQALFSMFVISSSTPVDGVGGQYVKRNENGVVPDGHRHLGAIYYYAERPILAGPVIRDMPDDTLWMGDLLRFPSYLYYYLLSFPVRIAMQIGASDITIIHLVRFIGIIFGLLALLIFRKITQLVTNNVTIQNISSLALALTGSFVWLSAAENYDIFALLLWFAFVYVSMCLFIKKDAKYLYWMALWFFLLSVTKYTYIPFAGVFGVVALGLYAKNGNALSASSLKQSVITDMKAMLQKVSKWQAVAGIILLVIGAGLFSERIIGNLAVYRSFNPSCSVLHTHEACMQFGVYARNYNQKERLANGTTQPIEYVPVVGYPAYWVKRYFDSMYVYMGHIYIPMYSFLVEIGGIVAAIIGIIMLVVARIKKIRLFRSQTEWYVFGIVILLTVAQFIFNVNTALNYGGQSYAHQGRYLLPVAGFAYMLYLIVLLRVYARQSANVRRKIVGVGLIVAIYSILILSAIPSFLIHATHSGWYSQAAQNVLPEWLISRD